MPTGDSGGRFQITQRQDSQETPAERKRSGQELDSINQHERGRESLMRMTLRQCVWVLAVALGTGITGGTVRAAVAPIAQEQAHDQDYSRNKTYQQGLREGKDDSKKNKDHSKKRHFKKDEDQKAYEAGYQHGHQGDQRDR